jgi:hypothetical protein
MSPVQTPARDRARRALALILAPVPVLALSAALLVACESKSSPAPSRDGKPGVEAGSHDSTPSPGDATSPEAPAGDARRDSHAAADRRAVEASPHADESVGGDATTVFGGTVSDTWYSGSHTCGAASLKLAKSSTGLDVQLLQIPASQVQGTCTGHSATVTRSGSDLLVSLSGNTSSSCWTACWDLSFTIVGLPAGTYQVGFLGLTGSITL